MKMALFVILCAHSSYNYYRHMNVFKTFSRGSDSIVRNDDHANAGDYYVMRVKSQNSSLYIRIFIAVGNFFRCFTSVTNTMYTRPRLLSKQI